MQRCLREGLDKHLIKSLKEKQEKTTTGMKMK